jgi:hypothetical protein
LKAAAKANSFILVKNGKASHTTDTKQFLCNQATYYRGKTIDNGSELPAPAYKSISIKNQKNNGRGEAGKTGPKRRETSRPSCKEGACKVCFVVGLDATGFYILGGRGFSVHTGHAELSSKEMPVSINDLTVEQAQICLDVNSAFANLGVAGNIIFQKFGLALPRNQIRCIAGFEHGKDGIGNLIRVAKANSPDDGHKLIQFSQRS